jgi:hypothetical protein
MPNDLNAPADVRALMLAMGERARARAASSRARRRARKNRALEAAAEALVDAGEDDPRRERRRT